MLKLDLTHFLEFCEFASMLCPVIIIALYRFLRFNLPYSSLINLLAALCVL